ncbi:FAD/NAD(P)-binding protein [Brachybacterium sp. MASK1Z-5]|uniref:FAD/NAD(P)-binding protein n=1 Tax=Brachybacterium halotolerans TaxID=2795215 RepID=A0ABS1BEB1_9MICO|nr:FAD/NAD(P)-binding protein [Brachybacterium halotolerans]MBK0332487.1 FAD/NAD(P)-binding protein [Brachybacterium halotolerans]MBK0333011.1 FAD/NAD(P)-binding protein [Brachybacterium halotolerans]
MSTQKISEDIRDDVSADVIIVGAGVSGTSTLLRLLEEQRTGTTGTDRLRVAVIDRSDDMFTGLPYGSRAGSASLIVTSLDEFLPDGIRQDFIAWLEARKERILAADASLGISPHWAEEHAEEIRGGQWDSLFIPRRLFGHFLRGRVEDILASTSDVEVIRITGEAGALRRTGTAARADGDSDGDVEILVAAPGGRVEDGSPDGPVSSASDGTDGAPGGITRVRGRSVVLAVGSPPTRVLGHDPADAGSGRFLDDTHVHGMDHLLQEARAAIRAMPEGASRDILVVGANADALELLHAAVRAGLERAWDHHVTVLATHGIPDAWTVHPDRRSEYRSRHLADYAARTPDADLTARAVFDAVVRDVDDAMASGFCEQDTVDELKELCSQLFERLPAPEQKLYVDVYGTKVGRFARPTGGDYQRTASELLESGRVHAERGHFEHAENSAAGWRVTTSTEEGISTLERTFGVIINCAGFENVAETRDGFLRSLQDESGLRSSTSRTGFEVDEHFQAAPGVFVAGPLLAGNLNSALRVWHLESCRRILAMADTIGAEIAAHLRATELEPV